MNDLEQPLLLAVETANNNGQSNNNNNTSPTTTETTTATTATTTTTTTTTTTGRLITSDEKDIVIRCGGGSGGSSSNDSNSNNCCGIRRRNRRGGRNGPATRELLRMNHNVFFSFVLMISYGISEGLWGGPVFAAYLKQIYGGKNAPLGQIEAIHSIAELSFAIPIGYLSDKYGRSIIIKFGSILFLLTSIFHAITTYWIYKSTINNTTTMLLLLIIMALWGIGAGIVDGPCEALFADSTKPGKQRTRLYTQLEILYLLASALGPLLSLIIFRNYPGDGDDDIDDIDDNDDLLYSLEEQEQRQLEQEVQDHHHETQTPKWNMKAIVIIIYVGLALEGLNSLIMMCFDDNKALVTADDDDSDDDDSDDDSEEEGEGEESSSSSDDDEEENEDGWEDQVDDSYRHDQDEESEVVAVEQVPDDEEDVIEEPAAAPGAANDNTTAQRPTISSTTTTTAAAAAVAVTTTRRQQQQRHRPSLGLRIRNDYQWMIPYILLASELVASASIGLTETFFPLYLKDDCSMTPTQVQILYGIEPLFIAAMTYIASKTASNFGISRRIEIILFFYALSIICFAVIPIFNLRGGSNTKIFLLMTLHILTSSFGDSVIPLEEALLADVVPRGSRARWMSISNSLSSVHQSATAIIGGYLSDYWGYRRTFLLTVFGDTLALALFASLLLLRTPPSTTDDSTTNRRVGRHGPFSMICGRRRSSVNRHSVNFPAVAASAATATTTTTTTTPTGGHGGGGSRTNAAAVEEMESLVPIAENNHSAGEEEDDESSSEEDEGDVENYDDYDWSELPKEVKASARLLGYSKRIWDNELETEFEDFGWNELTREQRKAAKVLGYNEARWNG